MHRGEAELPCNTIRAFILVRVTAAHLTYFVSTAAAAVRITRRFAPRAAYAARNACSGRKNSVKRKKKSPCLVVISANWRLENAKSPAAMLQEYNPQTPHASVHRVCAWYVVFAIYI